MPRDRSAVPSTRRADPTGEGGASPELLAPNFSLRQLAYFVAVAHHQSVLRAAQALNVSAPAVSAAIAHLESEIGERLFVRRHARGMVTTEAGNTLAIECRNLLAQSWSLGSGRLSGRRDVHGSVHLGCLLSFAPFLVPPLVRDFRERFPKAQVDWHEGNQASLMDGLTSGAFELAIMYDFEMPSGIECQPLRPAPLQVVLPRGHRLARLKRVTAADLVDEPMVLLELPRSREYMLAAFGPDGATPRIAFRTASITMLRSLVASGLGYSLLNFCPPFADPRIGALVTRPFETRQRTPNMVVARSRLYRSTPAARALVDCAARLVRDLPFSAERTPRRTR